MDGAVLAQMSTIGLAATDAAPRAPSRPARSSTRPCSGPSSRPRRQAGRARLRAGGVRERVDPVFDAVGAKTLWLGEAGAAQRLKLVLNTWLLGLTEGLAEAIALAEGLGVDPRTFLATIDGGPVGAPYAQLKGPMMIDGEFPPSFPLELAPKDARLALEAAEEAACGWARWPRWRSRCGARSRRATARRTWRRRSTPAAGMSRHGASTDHRRLPERLRPPDGALAVPAGEEIAEHINAQAASGDYELVIATRDWHPPDHGSFAEQGGTWPPHCVQGTDGRGAAPGARQRADRRDRRQGPGPRHRGLLGFEATVARGAAARRAASTAHDRRARHRLCVKDTALDALREGFAVASTARASAASTSSRATPSAPSTSWRRRVRRWRSRPRSDGPRERLLERLRPHVDDARVLARSARAARPLRARAPAREAWDNVALPIGAGQTISQPLVVARMCELLALARRRARARRRHRLRLPRGGAGAARRPRVEHRAPPRAVGAGRPSSLAAAGVDNVTLRGRRRRRRATRTGALRRHQRRRRDGRGAAARCPSSSPPAAASSGRSTPPTSGSCCCAAARRGLERSAHERVRFVPLVSEPG